MTGMTVRIGLRIGVLALGGLVAACSSSSGGGATAAPTPAASAAPSAAASGATGTTVTLRQNATLGAYLAGADGKTLYVFKMDTAGTSNCSGQCATSWPPLTVPAGTTPSAGTGVTGELATIQRADGTTQVTIGGSPVYYFAGDTAPDQTNGQGYKDLWYVAGPDGKGLDTDEDEASPSPKASSGGKYSY